MVEDIPAVVLVPAVIVLVAVVVWQRRHQIKKWLGVGDDV